MDESQQCQLNVNGLDFIFWGYCLIFVDIRISGYDILPNFIGYVLIIIGLTKLSHYHQHFIIATFIARILFLLSLFDFYKVNEVMSNFAGIPALIGLTLSICLYYHLIYGIIEIAKLIENLQVQEDGRTAYHWLLGINIIMIIIIISSWFYAPLISLQTLVFIIAGLLVDILFLCYLKRSQNALHGKSILINEPTIEYNWHSPLNHI
ncbi:hypothetical protein RBG61_13795 [Paludicola sp. MB14-C6]|uniref:hypothetical protein n=1 Tax=Paludihabitans sp. MB14-C6 TaxID=3070656 RepID=UPI0027DE79E8|nr:hypothetical protein [Paludicola sp. MB14-C6]WMJ23043.1 hypothetical protein RBG61_13795 [Paludicola sp. MB14-C6]